MRADETNNRLLDITRTLAKAEVVVDDCTIIHNSFVRTPQLPWNRNTPNTYIYPHTDTGDVFMISLSHMPLKIMLKGEKLIDACAVQ